MAPTSYYKFPIMFPYVYHSFNTEFILCLSTPFHKHIILDLERYTFVMHEPQWVPSKCFVSSENGDTNLLPGTSVVLLRKIRTTVTAFLSWINYNTYWYQLDVISHPCLTSSTREPSKQGHGYWITPGTCNNRQRVQYTHQIYSCCSSS